MPATADAVRLYVFPHAGGSGLMYQDWPARFPPGWRVVAVDPPGHGTLMGQPPLTDGNALIGHLLDRLGPELRDTTTPFAFFGHSMGALVAHELTHRLVDDGPAAPVWLGLSACGAPSSDAPPAPLPAGEPSDEELRRIVVRLGGTPRKVLEHDGLWRLFAPVIRADLRLVRGWRPTPARAPLPVPVSVFGGAQDRAVGLEALERWVERCARLLSVHVFPGGHFYFHDDLDALAHAVVVGVTTALESEKAPQEKREGRAVPLIHPLNTP
ncbi:alpha/beta fold hydrolase [Streptomyces sp. NPDC020298]|uniref:thioesterase II family protein n=1 Tax=unclassified Streptomyces TaxID=2593676 RepID=UPI0033FC57E4